MMFYPSIIEHAFIYIYIYTYIYTRSFNGKEHLFENEFLYLQVLADFCLNQHWPHNTLIICWELLHDQTTLNRSVLGEKLFSLNSSKEETQHTQLSSTCLPQLFCAWTFSPPPPSLHCYLKREVKLMIIQLSQTDLSKRSLVLLEFAPCVWVSWNIWYLGSFLSTLFLQLPATGRGRKGCQSLNLDAFGWFLSDL